jgi:hypothetical protein
MMVRAQDTEIYGAPDPKLLEWAAQNGYILLYHDSDTIPGFAYDRVNAGLPMPGVLMVKRPFNYEIIIDNLLLIIAASSPEEWANKVTFLPL